MTRAATGRSEALDWNMSVPDIGPRIPLQSVTSPTDQSDAALIKQVRDGRTAAYGHLYDRHLSAAQNLARQLARDRADQADFVSEAFSKVLDQLHASKGPESAFRSYLLTTLRHIAYDKRRKERRLELTDDVTVAADLYSPIAFIDTAELTEDRTLAVKAFNRLPKRWKEALFRVEILEMSPSQAAPDMGLTPNGMAALGYRARAALRAAYLQVSLSDHDVQNACRWTVDRLGAWTTGGLCKRDTKIVRTHVDKCEMCQERARALCEINMEIAH